MMRLLGLGLILMVAGAAAHACDGGRCGRDGTDQASAKQGARTPEELLDRLEAVFKSGAPDLTELVSLLHPDDQRVAAFIASVATVHMADRAKALATDEKMLELEAAARNANKRIASYGLEGTLEKTKSRKNVFIRDKSSLADAVAKVKEAMKDLDHKALVAESMPPLERLRDKPASINATPATKARVARFRATLKVDGDRATISDPDGGDSELVLIRAKDGFWYLSASSMFFQDR